MRHQIANWLIMWTVPVRLITLLVLLATVLWRSCKAGQTK